MRIGQNRAAAMLRINGISAARLGVRRWRYVSKDGKRHTRWKLVKQGSSIPPATKPQVLRLGRGYGLQIQDL